MVLSPPFSCYQLQILIYRWTAQIANPSQLAHIHITRNKSRIPFLDLIEIYSFISQAQIVLFLNDQRFIFHISAFILYTTGFSSFVSNTTGNRIRFETHAFNHHSGEETAA